MARNISISLGGHLDEFISQQIVEGRDGSASEVARAPLRLLEEREDKLLAFGKRFAKAREVDLMPTHWNV